jgi:2-iminobutanoate/2-iminopropanoate deaminase
MLVAARAGLRSSDQPVVNAIYAPSFPEDPPARIFVCAPQWPGPFDIEIDCVAMI